MKVSKRRKYLVNRPMQFSYMGLVSIPLILLLAGLYYLIYYMVFNEMLIPEAIVATLLPAMKKVNIVLLVALPIALGFLLISRKYLFAALLISGEMSNPNRKSI